MNKSDIPEYQVWSAMKHRCFAPSFHGYARYGGRGITVCERWRNSFENFLADMGQRPDNQHTLDRINNDGNYEPGNCRWANDFEQQRNKPSVIKIRIKGRLMCITEIVEEYGVSRGRLYSQYKKNGTLSLRQVLGLKPDKPGRKPKPRNGGAR